MNFVIGECFASGANKLIKKHGKPDFISSHGQTIYHVPANSTLQIGESSVISARTECIVEASEKPVFNFPIIQGSILEGNTFEPLANATVTLKMDGKEVDMADITWANPLNTYSSTKGSYSFWPKAIEAENADETKKFNFSIEVKRPGYDQVNYAFDTVLISENKIRKELDTTVSLKIMDLVMFREEIKNTMDRMIKD